MEGLPPGIPSYFLNMNFNYNNDYEELKECPWCGKSGKVSMHEKRYGDSDFRTYSVIVGCHNDQCGIKPYIGEFAGCSVETRDETIRKLINKWENRKER